MKANSRGSYCTKSTFIEYLVFIVLILAACGCQASKEGQLILSGERSYAIGQYESSVAQFNQAIEMNPSSYSAYKGRAQAYTKMGKFKKALLDYNKAIEIDPELPDAFFARAEVYERTGQRSKALKDLYRTIEIEPRFSSPYCTRGKFYLKNRQFELALADINECIRIRTRYGLDRQNLLVDPYTMLALVWSEKRQHDKAVYYIKEARVYLWGSMVLENKGEIDHACEYMEKYLEIIPWDKKGQKRLIILRDKLSNDS